MRPSRCPLYEESGRVFAKLGRFEEAAAAFRQALTFRRAPELYEELSAAHLGSGDSNQAAIALLEAVLTDPRNDRITSAVAHLYQQADPAGCAIQTLTDNPA